MNTVSKQQSGAYFQAGSRHIHTEMHCCPCVTLNGGLGVICGWFLESLDL